MFQALSDLIKASGLRGIDLTVRPMSDNNKMSVMLSFNQAGEFEQKLLQKHDDATVTGNADAVIALRAALNTPLVIIGEPNEIISKIEHELNNLREGVITAATSYSALDISALLTKAATQAKSEKTPTGSAKAKTESKKAPAAQEADKNEAAENATTTSEAEMDAEKVDKTNESERSDTQIANDTQQQSVSSFNDFDSL